MAESTTRVEAFSDGVFAIAITLLVLEIRLPEHTAGGAELTVWTRLAALWPSYLAFLLSFFVILIMWINHHELMRLIRAVDYPFLFANGLLLLTVSFVPFPTAVLAGQLATPESAAAVAFYCGTFVINSLAWALLWITIVRRGLLRSDVQPTTLLRIRNAYAAGPLVYAVATVVAFYRPLLGLAINASLWLLWIRLCYHSSRGAPPEQERRPA
jgi:uncharacterized membrane protein